MDIEFFVNKDNAEIVGDITDKIGLYIVQQSQLPPKFDNMRRCGDAGTKEVIDARNQSSFRTRVLMYLSNWITGGVILACLTVPRSIYVGFSQKQINRNEGDNRDH